MGYEPNVFYFFGFPRAIEPGGVAVNVRVGGQYGNSDNDKQKRANFSFQMGILSSALEHAVPEQMFTTDPNNPAQGVSAVKALQLASQQGQRIYHITPANMATTLPNINIGSEAKSEILSALNMGREVITHTSNISVPGWTGAGYIMFEPDSGQGAFKISGGGNGGFLAGLLLANTLILFLTLALTAAPLGPIAGVGALIALIGGAIVASVLILTLGDSQDFVNCFAAGLKAGLAIAGAGASITGSIISQILSTLGLVETVSSSFNCTLLGTT